MAYINGKEILFSPEVNVTKTVEIVQTTGDSTEVVMSQKAVTDAITKAVDEVDCVDIVQETGTSETAVMSQKAVTDALKNIGFETDSKIPTDGLAYELSADGTHYICTGIGTATDTDIVISSNINDVPVTSIGTSAFYGCFNLTSVTIGNSVTEIGKSAFELCYDLTSITIGDSVTSIGESTFAFCYALTSVTIPDSVTLIGKDAFYGCPLTSLYIDDLAAVLF